MTILNKICTFSLVHSTDHISKIATRLLLKEPFYGHFLLGMPKAMDTSIETACVSLHNNQIIKLSVNPEYWKKLEPEKQFGLIKHEILHVALKHLFMLKDFPNKSIFNIAADLVVNQYIVPSQLPEGALTLDRFDYTVPMYNIQLEPEKSTKYYYNKLVKILQKPPLMTAIECEKKNVPVTGLDELMAPSNANQKKHQQWKAVESLSKAEIKVMEYQLFNHVKNVVEKINRTGIGYGLLPSKFVEYLKGFLKSYEPQVNWKRVLKQFATSSTSSFIKNTLRRPSKRYGTTPGTKVKRRSRILVALDTSGSVPTSDIEIFFAELHHIWKQGADVVIAECDAAIRSVYKYQGTFPKGISGRGGTSFHPIIELANNDIHPDGIIYFTDGFALPPTKKSRCPMLWIITSKGINEDSKIWSKLQGRKVKIN